MALKGSYVYKGITVSDAYVKVTQVSYSSNEYTNNQLKTAAVYNSDGSIKTAAVYEDVVVKSNQGNYTAKIWKDKAVRDAAGKYNDDFNTVNGSFTMSVVANAKNPVVQAYTAMKAEDKWKDYTDI
tara:strand:+ start:507 stop:884 length:378 start_codon:yes stop_codon:yes gene_type:complete